MKVLVTGGAGYLGSVIVPKLLEKGHEVSVLDNFLYGKESLQHVLDKITVFEGDVRNMTTVVKAINSADVVIHLASIVGDQASDLDSRTTIEINYLSTKNIAELCKMYEKKLIFASTCSVYGDSQKEMMNEDDETIEPVSLYGETKLKSENALKEIGSNYAILRLGTLFGFSNRMRFDLVINLFVAKAMNKEKITVFGGDQFRPFLHISDAADAFIKAVEDDWKGIINVSWKNYKLIDVANELKEKLNVEVEISTDIVDKRNYYVDNSKVKGLGFEPTKDLDFFIEQMKDFKNISEYKHNKFSNFASLFEDVEKQKKIYTLGPLGEKE